MNMILKFHNSLSNYASKTLHYNGPEQQRNCPLSWRITGKVQVLDPQRPMGRSRVSWNSGCPGCRKGSDLGVSEYILVAIHVKQPHGYSNGCEWFQTWVNFHQYPWFWGWFNIRKMGLPPMAVSRDFRGNYPIFIDFPTNPILKRYVWLTEVRHVCRMCRNLCVWGSNQFPFQADETERGALNGSQIWPAISTILWSQLCFPSAPLMSKQKTMGSTWLGLN